MPSRLRVESLFARGREIAQVAEQLRGQAASLSRTSSALLWLTDARTSAAPLAEAMASCSAASIGAVTQAGVLGGGVEHKSRLNEVCAAALAISLPDDAAALPFHSAPDGLPDLPSEVWSRFAAAEPDDSPHLMLIAAPPRDRAFPLERWLGMMDVALPWAKKVGGLTAGGHSTLFVGAKEHDGGAVGLALENIGFEARSFQGAVPVGPSYEITASDGNLIHALDGKPVGETFGESLEELSSSLEDGSLMCGVSVPSRAAAVRDGKSGEAGGGIGHEYVVRQLLGYSKEHSVLAVGASPDLLEAAGARFQWHSFSAEAARAEMAAGARTLQHLGCRGGLMVSCLGRGEALYHEPGVETAAMHAELGPEIALAGLFAGGEVGPVGDRTFVHTYTTTVGLLRERGPGGGRGGGAGGAGGAGAAAAA